MERVESPERNIHIYGQLIFNGTNVIKWRKYFMKNDA